MFSINPIYPKLVTGGASKHLHNIAGQLGRLGHSVTVLCTRAKGSSEPFLWQEGVWVEPSLTFKQPFPDPYAISAGDLAFICDSISKHLNDSDRFYMHDGELLLPFLHSDIPTIISYRDNVYPESILGSFISGGDQIIAVPNYSADVIRFSVGRIFPQINNRIQVIPNGIDFDLFHPTDTNSLLKVIPVDPSQDAIILHPHRPEEGKGLMQTLKVSEILVKKYGVENLKVLVPEWIPEMASNTEKIFYEQFQDYLSQMKMSDHFIFHSWLPQSMMPAYYSLGRVTLCLGTLVEAFGNVAYESLACGTPSIVAKVGVHRSMLPDNLIYKVDYDDADTSALITLNILKSNEKYTDERIELIKPFFDLDVQMTQYNNLIIHCKKMQPSDFDPILVERNTEFVLAPWCYLGKNGIYHDFRSQYCQDPLLIKLVKENKIAIKLEDVNSLGGNWEHLYSWYRDTYLVPLPN